MTTYNTGNPLGSVDVKDLYDNAENLDDAVNSLAPTWVDRFGRTRSTMQGVITDAVTASELAANDGALKIGYLPAGTGAIPTDVQSRLREHDAQLANVEGNLNFTTLPAATTPVANTDLLILRQGSDNKKVEIGEIIDAAVDASVDASLAATADAVAAAETAEAGAVAAQVAAETARDAAVVNADVYADTAAGLAATTVGQQFVVVDGVVSIRYRHDAGPVATELVRYSTAAITTPLAINTRISEFSQRDTFVASELGQPIVSTTNGTFNLQTVTVNASGEFVLTNTSSFSATVIVDVGKKWTRQNTLRVNIDWTLDVIDPATSTSAHGAVLVIGDTPADRRLIAYYSNGAIGLFTAASGGITTVVDATMAFTNGARVQLDVEIKPNGDALVVATSPTGKRRSVFFVLPQAVKGAVAPGIRRGITELTIHKFAAVTADVTKSELPVDAWAGSTNPNEIKSPGNTDTSGWTKSKDTSALSIESIQGTKALRLSHSESAEAGFDVIRDLAQDRISYRFNVLQKTITAGRVFITQHTDAAGRSFTPSTEISGTRVTINMPSGATTAPRTFTGNVALSPQTRRIVFFIGTQGAGNVFLSEMMIAYGDDTRYRQPRVLGGAPSQPITPIIPPILSGSFDEPIAGVAPPDEFTFVDYGFRIFRGVQSKRFITDFIPQSKQIATNVTLYVDPANGNDTNAGTQAAPFATVAKAFTEMNSLAVPCTIALAQGEYNADSVGTVPTITQNHNLVCFGDAPAVLTLATTETGWELDTTYPNLWKKTVTGAAPLWAYDNGVLDEYEEGRALRVRTISDANNNLGSVHVDGQTIYVRTHNDREPDSDFRVLRNLPGINLGTTLWYWENVHFLGGSDRGVTCANNTTGDSCFSKVRLSYAYAGNAFRSDRDRAGRIFVFRSVASYSRTLDGWNYHNASSACSDVVEIDCIGHHNGLVGGPNNNGSTMHDGGRIIRVGGDYSYNQNRNIHDINNGTEVWMLGSVAGDALTTDTNPYRKANFLFGREGVTETTYAWMDSCISRGGVAIDFGVYPGSRIRIRNTDIGNRKVIVEQGLIETY